MAVTSEMVVQVEQLYVALFNRAPDAEGLGYWAQRMSNGESWADIANAMYATEPARATYPLYLTNAEIVAAFYENVLGRPGDAEGLGYWEAMMNAPGATPGSVIAAMIDVVTNYDGDDADGLASAALFANKVAVADYFVRNVGTIEGSQAALQGVTADPDSVGEAIAAIGSTPEGAADTHLTVRWDNLVGTAGNDVFTARVVQDDVGSGAQTNQLGSGDMIDGKGGTDILDAKVTSGVYAGGGLFGTGSMPIHPETTSVEIVRLGAMEANVGNILDALGLSNLVTNLGIIPGMDGLIPPGLVEYLLGNNNTQVYINAQNMYGVNEISSYYSDADLNVLNMTSLANDGETMRSISDMTVSMVHTGNSDSRWGASDMAVLFDQDYLVPVESLASTAWYWLLDQDADDAGLVNKLDHINVDGLRFSLDGGPTITLASPDAQFAGTWEGFVAALQPALQALIDAGVVPSDMTLTLDPSLARTTYLDSGATSSPVPAMVLHTEQNIVIEPIGFSQVTDAIGEYNVWGRLSNKVDTDSHLSINIDLEKAGRAGDGGELQVGSMHKATFGDYINEYDYDYGFGGAYGEDYHFAHLGDDSQYPNLWLAKYADAGIPEFNVTVKGDASKPSSLSALHSTNGVLETIRVATSAAETGDKGYASLRIGNENSPTAGIWDVATVDASAFKGDFELWADFGMFATAAKYGGAIDLNYTFGSGNDTLVMDIHEPGTNVAKYWISMGEGDDRVSINLDADAVDAISESFLLDLGNGNNEAVIWVDNSGDYYYDSNDADGFTKATTDILKNLSVVAGSGDDYIEITGVDHDACDYYDIDDGTSANFNIKAGAGSDFVFIDAGGSWGWDQYYWSSNAHSNPWITAAPMPMYRGEVQVRYAGFESTMAIDVGSDFKLQTTELNAAIMKAIDASPELSRLLDYRLEPGNQALSVWSHIDGDNLFEISLFQPQLVASGGTPTNGSVIVNASDLAGLKAAIRATDPANIDSDDLANDGYVTIFNAWATAHYNNDAPASGTSFDVNGWSEYWASSLGTEGSVANSSVINMGPGANDLVVLSSFDGCRDGDAVGPGSSNTLVFDAEWGKVSIVNFFTNEDSLVNGDDGLLGNHKLNFTSWLNHKTTQSGSALSQDPIAITVDDATGGPSGSDFTANNVVFTNVDVLEVAAGGANTSYSFATLSAAQVAEALNAAGGFSHAPQTQSTPSSGGYVGTVQTSLLFVENIDAVKDPGGADQQDVISGVTGTNPYDNHGEYKVFEVTYGIDSAKLDGDFSVKLLGTLDFGHSWDLQDIGSAGGPSENFVGGLVVPVGP